MLASQAWAQPNHGTEGGVRVENETSRGGDAGWAGTRRDHG